MPFDALRDYSKNSNSNLKENGIVGVRGGGGVGGAEKPHLRPRPLSTPAPTPKNAEKPFLEFLELLEHGTRTPTMLLPIVVDTREQRPFAFHGRPVAVRVCALEAGDYSLAGFERRIAVERKSLVDLVGVLGRDRERFVRELARLRGYDCAAVVVEEPEIMLRTGRYRGGLNPSAAWQSVIALSARFRVPFFFCKDREDAEGVTFDILRHYARERWRELRALTTKQKGRRQ